MQAEAQMTSSKGPQYAVMRRILADLQAHPQAWAFLQPVNPEDVADYYSVVKHPMGKLPFGTLFKELINCT